MLCCAWWVWDVVYVCHSVCVCVFTVHHVLIFTSYIKFCFHKPIHQEKYVRSSAVPSIPANFHNPLRHCDAYWFSCVQLWRRQNSSRLFLGLLSTATVMFKRRAVRTGFCMHWQVRLTPLKFLSQRCTFIQRLIGDISQMLHSTLSSFSDRNFHFDPPFV